MLCPKCRGEIPGGYDKCPICGAPVEKVEKKCPNCGMKLSDEATFCIKCGYDLILKKVHKVAGRKEGVPPAMKKCPHCSRLIDVTALFCDYCGKQVSGPPESAAPAPEPPAKEKPAAAPEPDRVSLTERSFDALLDLLQKKGVVTRDEILKQMKKE